MMKHNIKYVMALAFVLLMTQGAWADPAVTIIKQLNGSAVTTTLPGEVMSEIADEVCTLTVTPASGYYVTSEYITAYSVVTGNVAQAPQRRSPNMDNDPITVTPIGNHSDPSAVTQYTLPMPADGSDVEVTVNFQTAQMYDIYIGGVQVSEFNFEDVLKDGHVSFNVENNILTLNNATIATESGNGIDSYVDELTIHLVGNSTMNHQIWMSNGVKKLKFTTSDETPGKLTFASDVTYPYEASGVNSWSNATYQNGLTLRRNADNAYIIALDMPKPQLTNSTDKLYYPDATFALAIESDNADSFDIYYSIGTGEATKYTEPFTIEGTSNATIYTYSIYRQYATDGDYKSNTHSYLIRRVDKPTFTPAGGTYDEAQAVKLGNLPENISANTYPQVWYYLGENENDSVQVTSAEQGIPVTESTKVCVYFIDEDSGKVLKSETVQAEYTILKEPELHFWTSSQSYITTGNSYGTIDFNDLEEFNSPTLKAKIDGSYTSDLTDLGITYSTSDETVATVDATGKVTIVGGGYVTIKAVSQQTDVYAADSTWYEIAVRPNAPQISLEKGVYYTGKKIGLNATMPNGKMYYKIGDNGTETEYTDSITLPVGTNEIIAYTYCGTGDKIMKSYGGSMVFFVYDKPVFSVASGTYNEPQEVTITTNIPADNPYVALYYKLNNSQTDSTLYHAGDKIMITETTRVCAYYWVQESDKYVSDPVEAHYVIRQDAGLAFVRDGEYVEVAEYTIGGNENLPLPTLQNENNLTVTYSSENTNVATVDATTGEVTIVGIGETTITATSEQTDVLQEGHAAYPLRVYKDLNYESITVTVANGTYTGEAVTPAVTVKDGQTDISAFFDFTYSDNVQVGTNAKVTIKPKELTDADNYYVGERTETFSIINRTLEVGKDVQFAEGQKWASLYTTTESLNLPEGVMAYIVTEVSATAATVTPINYVPKNVPVFLENGSTVTTDNASAEGNLLRGTSEQTAVSSILGTVFGLHNNKLMRVTSGSIPAGRAYLVTDEPQARELSIVFDTDITGIRMANVSTADDDNWYTMDGRKLQQKPVKKGVYIRNGKKVVINNK